MNEINKDLHDHENCEDCGCGHDHEEAEVIYLTLDDDTELECEVLGIFEVEDKEYIALLPKDEEEVLLYEYVELEDEEFDLLPIDDENEFDLISEAFYALYSDDDFEEFEFEEDEEIDND